MIRRPPRSPLFPSPTLFRSGRLERAFTANGVEVTAKAFRFFAPGRRIENHADAHGRYLSRVEARESSVKPGARSEEHTSELQSPCNLVCRLLLEKKKNIH